MISDPLETVEGMPSKSITIKITRTYRRFGGARTRGPGWSVEIPEMGVKRSMRNLTKELSLILANHEEAHDEETLATEPEIWSAHLQRELAKSHPLSGAPRRIRMIEGENEGSVFTVTRRSAEALYESGMAIVF